MKRRTTKLQTRLYLFTVIILVVGLGSAVLIYLTAGNESNGVLGYEAADGYVYPVAPEDSKKYMHDLELYGGKANVLANEFVSWFAGLWRGRSLAYTVACIAIFASLGFFFVANHLRSDLKADGPEDNKRTGTD